MKQFLLILLLALAPLSFFAQSTWYMDLPGNDYGDECVATYDGGVVMITFLEHKIIKLDANGTLLWSFVIDTSAVQYLIAVTETNDHGIVALGSKSNWAATIAFKLDENGNLLWQKQYLPAGQNLTAQFICPAHGPDGGFLFGGGECSMQTYVIRVHGNGSILWQKQYIALSGTFAGFLSSMVPMIGNGYLTTYSINTSGDLDWGLMKINDNGDFQWSKAIDEGLERDEVVAATPTQAGGIAVLGTTTNYQAPNNENKMTLTVFDSTGFRTAYVVYDYTEQLQPHDITQTTDGGFVITGSTFSLNTLLVKTDGIGTIQWQKLGTGASQEGMGVQPAAGNMFYISGFDVTHKATLAKFSGFTGQGLCNEAPVTLSPTSYYPTATSPSGTHTIGTATEAVINFPYHFETTQPTLICSVVASEDALVAPTITCIPNPFADRMRIEFGTTLTQDGMLNLYDLQGRMVATQPAYAGTEAIEVDASGVSDGLILIHLQVGNASYSLRAVHASR